MTLLTAGEDAGFDGEENSKKTCVAIVEDFECAC